MTAISTHQSVISEQIEGIPVDFNVTVESLSKKGKSSKGHHHKETTLKEKEVKVQAALNQALDPYKGANLTVSCRRKKHDDCFKTKNCTVSRSALLNQMITTGAITEPAVKRIEERAKSILCGNVPPSKLKVNI